MMMSEYGGALSAALIVAVRWTDKPSSLAYLGFSHMVGRHQGDG